MKRTLLFTASVLVLATAAIAAPPKKAPKTPTTITCSVMKGRMVDIKAATANHMYADYKGNRYFFCCGGCPGQFKKDPSKFVSSAHIAVPKKSAKS